MLPKADYIIPRAREFDMNPETWNGLSDTSKRTSKLHGKTMPYMWFIIIKRMCYCVYPSKEWKEAEQYILQRFIKQPGYIKEILKLHKAYGNAAQNLARSLLKNYQVLDEAAMLKSLVQIRKAWVDFDEVNVFPWLMGGESIKEYLSKELAEKYKLSTEEIELLCSADDLSLAAKEEVKTYQIAARSSQGESLKKELNYLSREFGWIPYGYDGPTYWDVDYYFNKIKNLKKSNAKTLLSKASALEQQAANTKKRQQELIKRYKINQRTRRLLEILHKLFILTDERKKFQFRLNHVYHKILEQLSKISGLTLPQLKYLQVEEIIQMFKDRDFRNYKTMGQERLGKPLSVYATNGKITEIKTGKVVLKKLSEFTLDIKRLKEFSGQVASKTGEVVVKGKVRILKSSREVDKMKSGEILVTGMTSPDFVPAMRKAKAIITDEGGITSHAAIVSRELGIPCIIGTKIATTLLKDGDIIELDMNKATVKLL